MAMPIKKLEIKPRVDKEIYGDSDSESSPSNSPTSRSHSSVNFTASSRSSSSSSSNRCFSGSISDEGDEEHVVDDDNCLDDWEAMADALTAVENKQQKHNPSSENGSQSGAKNECFCDNDISNENQKSGGTGICQAWRRGDAFRPQSLPNLSLLNLERQCAPKSCPICYEDLDGTDSSFFPCMCGFRLCLFCHNRILEKDGRCPGCRKKYNHDVV